MIRDLVTDPAVLSIPCEAVIEGDLVGEICNDLMDTAMHEHVNGVNGCAGLAANQIGYNKRVICVPIGGRFVPLINPEIVSKFGGQDIAEEGCLSCPGKRVKVKRYKRIRLAFNDYRNGRRLEFAFKGFSARVIQHEVDHLNGVTI